MASVTLEMRHTICINSDGTYTVIETFADHPRICWQVPTEARARAFVEERRDMLTGMVARISKEARLAVGDMRVFDNMKAGRA